MGSIPSPGISENIPRSQETIPEQILFSSPSPLASALGLSLLGFGFHATKHKRTFAVMKPWSLPFWSINFISRGGGLFESGPTGRLRIRAGEAFVRFPHEPCRYGHAPDGTWDEYWLLFDGALPARLAEEGRFDRAHPILRPAQGSFNVRFEEARLESLRKKPRVDVFARLLLDLLFDSPPETRRTRRSAEPQADDLRRFYERLHARVAAPMESLPALAAGIGNYHTLRRAFQKRYGLAPHRVLLEAKLLTARRLLLSTGESLTGIAGKIGFEDVSYFIRLFRKRFGVAPSRFRSQAAQGS
jgi:AraC-like DNA-binding protein